MEGRIELMERPERRRKQLLDDLKETTGYWKIKQEALDHTVLRTRFGGGPKPIVRQATERRMNESVRQLINRIVRSVSAELLRVSLHK